MKLRRLLDIVLPRRCAICHSILGPEEQCLCAACITRLPFRHFESPTDNDLVRRLWNTASVYSGETLLAYQADSDVHTLMQHMKYRGRTDLCQLMGRMLADKLMAQDFCRGIDMLIPIPLSRKRLRTRGYNQAEHIARGVSQATGIPVRTDFLLRIVDNPTQTSLRAADRMHNTAHIFQARNPNGLKGKHILLLDDVITTGSTTASALQTLTECVPRLTSSVACIALTSLNG